jgi:hypothetical protein
MHRRCLAICACIAAGVLQVRAQDPGAKTLVLVGELHGTTEIPRLFTNLATAAAVQSASPIAIGLELPVTLQKIVDDVTDAFDASAFRERLVQDAAWQQINDGRSSEAMADLISDVVKLSRTRRASVFFFDTQTGTRDEALAQFIANRVKSHNEAVTLVLTGNIHASVAPRFPRIPSIEPMGHRLIAQGLKVVSLNVTYSGGDAWVCIPECGLHKMNGNAGSPASGGYDDTLYVGSISASPPARARRGAGADCQVDRTKGCEPYSAAASICLGGPVALRRTTAGG